MWIKNSKEENTRLSLVLDEELKLHLLFGPVRLLYISKCKKYIRSSWAGFVLISISSNTVLKKLLQFMFFCPKSTYFHPVYGHSSESLIPSPSYYFQKIVSDIFILNKKWARELQNPFPTRSWIACHGPIVFFSTRLFNRFLSKLPFSPLSFPVNICIRYLFNLVISPRILCKIFSKM